MFYKLAFFDLDGTLIKGTRKISSENLSAICEYSQLGGNIVLCTGRWPISAFKLNKSIEDFCKIKNRYLISLNGSVIFDLTEKKIIKEESIPQIFLEKLLLFRKKFKIAMWIYTKYGVENQIIYSIRIPLRKIVSLFNSGKVTKLKQKKAKIEQPLKILFLSFSQKKVNRAYKWLSENLAPYLQITRTNKRSIEITKLGINKGVAVKFISQKMNIPYENAVSFGDSGNDISMFELTGLSVSINSENKKILEIASHNIDKKFNSAVAFGLKNYVIKSSNNFKKNISNIIIDLSYLNLNLLNKEIETKKTFNGFFQKSGKVILISSEQANEVKKSISIANMQDKVSLLFCLNACAVYSMSEKKYILSKYFNQTQVDAIVKIYNEDLKKDPNLILVFSATNMNHYVVSNSYMDYEIFLKKYNLKVEDYIQIEFNDLVKKHLSKISQLRIYGWNKKVERFKDFVVRKGKTYLDLNPSQGFMPEIKDVFKALQIEGNFLDLNKKTEYLNNKEPEKALVNSLVTETKKILLN